MSTLHSLPGDPSERPVDSTEASGRNIPTCQACDGPLGPDNIDTVCGPCWETGEAVQVAQAIASDIVRTADQYPGVREVRTFEALHDVYDVNESIDAGANAVGWFLSGVHEENAVRFRVVNMATDHLATEIAADGFAALQRIADGEV